MGCKYSFKLSIKYEHRHWPGSKHETLLLFMLLAVLQVNSIWHLKTSNIYLTDKECKFVFDDVLKRSRPSLEEEPAVFSAYL